MSKSRGRPQKNVNWPEGQFTPKQAIEYNLQNVSAGLVHLKIKKAIANGTLSEVGKVTTGKGRPSSLYSTL